jgi:putative acetyltransferase
VETIALRAYESADEAAAIELWRRTWQQAYPTIDFAARLNWWKTRWRDELVPSALITVAEQAGELIGFATVEPSSGYLDQIVVAPEAWGAGVAEMLLAHIKAISPGRLDLHVNVDNSRAIGFYRKHGFKIVGTEVNPRSGAPVYKMSWSG